MGLSFPSSQHLYTSLAAATSLVSRHKCLGQRRVAREQMHGCFAQSTKVGVCKRPGGQLQVHSFPSSKHLYTFLAADRSLASRHNCLGQSKRACWRMHNDVSRKAPRWAFANVQVDDLWGSHFQAHSTSIRRWLLPRALSVATNAWVKAELPVSRCTGALRKAPRWAFANVQVDNFRCTHFQAQSISIRCWLLTGALPVATIAWDKAEGPVGGCTTVPRAKRPGGRLQTSRWTISGALISKLTAPLYVAGC